MIEVRIFKSQNPPALQVAYWGEGTGNEYIFYIHGKGGEFCCSKYVLEGQLIDEIPNGTLEEILDNIVQELKSIEEGTFEETDPIIDIVLYDSSLENKVEAWSKQCEST